MGISTRLRHSDHEDALIYIVTPKPDRQTFVNNEKANKKYQILMVRFSKVVHPTRHSEIQGVYDKI